MHECLTSVEIGIWNHFSIVYPVFKFCFKKLGEANILDNLFSAYLYLCFNLRYHSRNLHFISTVYLCISHDSQNK